MELAEVAVEVALLLRIDRDYEPVLKRPRD
jgi:hypothetical protein